MQTIIALPSIASTRLSKCFTRSSATILILFGSPTSASSAAHLDFSFSFFVSSSPSVISSNSSSIPGKAAAFRLSFDMRLS